jgi:hypothetical protein
MTCRATLFLAQRASTPPALHHQLSPTKGKSCAAWGVVVGGTLHLLVVVLETQCQQAPIGDGVEAKPRCTRPRASRGQGRYQGPDGAGELIEIELCLPGSSLALCLRMRWQVLHFLLASPKS